MQPHYVNLNCRILRGFSSWIRRHGYTRENALEHFHPGRLPQKEKVPLTPGEQQALFSSIKGRFRPRGPPTHACPHAFGHGA